MKYLKKLLKSTIVAIASILILTLLFTLLNYFNIINNKVLNIFNIIIPIFSLALAGYILGKKSSKNGWLEGLKLGIIIIILMLIITLILNSKIEIKNLIFYLLLILSSSFGSMLGINKKKET